MGDALVLLWVIPYLAVLWFLRRYRIWILFYLVGTIGCAFLLTQLLSQVIDVHTWLSQSVARSVHVLLIPLNIETRIVTNAPGVLLVLVLTQRIGWTILQIGIESSGLLEMVVLTSLVMYYPGWSLRQRLVRSLVGVILSWGANLLRMLIIAAMLHFFGKEVLVLAHTFVGKLVFFIMTLAIYWFLITYPSLGDIDRNIARQRWVKA